MTNTVDLSDETIEKLSEAIRGKIAPLTYPTYRDWTPVPYPRYYHPYPFVTSLPNSGSVPGSSYGSQAYNG